MRRCKDGHALRTVSSAVAVVSLAVASHAAAGGHVPGLLTLGLLTLATAGATAPLTRRSLPLPGLLLVLGVLQLVLHTALEAHGYGEPAAHGHGATAATVAMVAAHSGATLLTALAFAQGRAALRAATVWSSLRHLLHHPPHLLPAPSRLPVLADTHATPTSVVPSTVRGRAPPSLVPHA